MMPTPDEFSEAELTAMADQHEGLTARMLRHAALLQHERDQIKVVTLRADVAALEAQRYAARDQPPLAALVTDVKARVASLGAEIEKLTQLLKERGEVAPLMRNQAMARKLAAADVVLEVDIADPRCPRCRQEFEEGLFNQLKAEAKNVYRVRAVKPAAA